MTPQRIGRTLAESTAAPSAPVRPPEGAPNVVIILLDDTGFAQLGCFGSDIETPNIDRLAAGGLRYHRFHVTALCSPTRACILTGRNHHAVGMDFAEFAVHFTTDEITEFTGPDTARGVCRFAVHTGRSPNIQGAGTYRDEYRRTPDGWRFVSRLISFFYMGERAIEWPSTPPSITPPTVDMAEGI